MVAMHNARFSSENDKMQPVVQYFHFQAFTPIFKTFTGRCVRFIHVFLDSLRFIAQHLSFIKFSYIYPDDLF